MNAMLPKAFSFTQNKLYIFNMSKRCVNMNLGQTGQICAMCLLVSVCIFSLSPILPRRLCKWVNDIERVYILSLCRNIHL